MTRSRKTPYEHRRASGTTTATSRHPQPEGVAEIPSYNVKVTGESGEVHVQVDHGLTGAGHPHLFLRASSSAAPILAHSGRWPTGLAWSVTDRLRNGGDEKGRVLGIWQERPNYIPIPLSVLAWHLHGTGPLYVLDAGHSDELIPEVGRELVALLLDALLEVAAHRKTPVASEWQRRLRWSQAAIKHAPHSERTGYRRENLRRAGALSFTKHQPPRVAADWTRGAWLGERAF